MKNVVEFPGQAALDEEAAAWLVRLDSDEPLSDVERYALAEWLQRSPRHRERLTSLAEFWGRLNVLTELAVPVTLDARRPVDRLWSYPRWLWVATATIAVGALILLAVLDIQPGDITASNGLYSSAIGEQQSALLADGSEVVLNTNSQIRVEFNAAGRDIHLIQGEVMFSVAEDAERPFRVFAGGGRIQAVGTAFSVYLRDNSVDITVTEGTVSLSVAEAVEEITATGVSSAVSTVADASFGVLSAGQVATIPRLDESQQIESNATETREVAEWELNRRVAWTDGKLSFAGESLEQVVREISRYTTVKIEFADPKVGAIRVGGVFPIGETGAMFGALEDNFGLTVTYLSANRVLIAAAE